MASHMEIRTYVFLRVCMYKLWLIVSICPKGGEVAFSHGFLPPPSTPMPLCVCVVV